MISGLADGIVAGKAILEQGTDNSGITIILEPLEDGAATSSLTAPGSDGIKRAVTASDSAPHTALTNVDGTFTISNVSPGRYLLTATKVGYGNAHEPDIAVKSNAVTTVNVGLKTPASVTGSILYPEGTDHSGILVYIEGTSTFAVTDTEGNFSIGDLSEGEWTIAVKEYGYRTYRQDIVLVSGGTLALDPIMMLPVGMAGSGVITGRVVDKGNNPLEDVEVKAGGLKALTDEDGLFTIHNLPEGTYDVSAAGHFTGNRVLAVGVAAGDTVIMEDIVFDTSKNEYAELKGSVMPMGSEASIRILEAGALLKTEKINIDGSWHIRDIRPGVYRVEAVAVGYVTSVMDEGLTAIAGNVHEIDEITLQRAPGIVAGTVKDSSGQPLEGAVVTASSELFTETGADGKYYLSLPEGQWDITVTLTGYLPYTGLAGVNVISGVQSTGNNVTLSTVPANSIIADIELPYTPGRIITRGNKAYISFPSVSRVGMLDLESQIMSNLVDVGSSPQGMAITQDGTRLYVACEFGDSVNVINLSSFTLSSTISTGTGSAPVAVAVSSAGKVYCALSGTDKVAVIDSYGVIETQIHTSRNPVDITVSEPHDSIYVACSNANVVDRISTLTDQFVESIAASQRPISLSVYGNRLFAACIGAGAMTAISLSDHTVIGNYTTGLQPASVRVDENDAIYISNRGSGSVSVFAPDTLTMMRTVSIGNEPGESAVTSDGRYLVLRPQARRLVILSPAE